MINSTFRTPIDALEYFALLVADETKTPLAEVAANIAQVEYPQLSLDCVANHFDLLVQKFCMRIKSTVPPLQKIGMLNEYLYQEMNFRGHNHKIHDNIDLSCINFALECKQGSDAMMSIIYLEIANALKLQARGIIFPEQVLIKIRLTRPTGHPAEVIINPSSGKSLNAEDIQQLLAPFKNKHGLIGEYDIPCDLFLETASSKDIITHALFQMKGFYHAQCKWPSLIQILDRLIILQPDHIDNYRERGYAHIKIGRPQKAITDLEHYLQHARIQFVGDAHIVEHDLSQLRNAPS
ncbi:MAG: tetratricopeptide repeat protein [Saezia sp.]